MIGSGSFPTVFAVFAIGSQLVLVAFFAARRWRPELADRWGWIAYVLGIPALGLGVASAIADQPLIYVAAGVLFAAWAAYGATLDLGLHTEWRSPVKLSFLVPFVLLYTAAQIAFWIPLWYVNIALWIAYAVLYTVNTALNVRGHVSPAH